MLLASEIVFALAGQFVLELRATSNFLLLCLDFLFMEVTGFSVR